MTHFPDVMVDIETTGLKPDRNAMIQLAAVRFNLETREVDTNFFSQSLAIPPWRYWDEATWDWWSSKPTVLRGIIEKMQDPAVVMKNFIDWSFAIEGQIPTWFSKPSHFDFPFVSSYCSDYGMPIPYDFRAANDMRSFMRGRAWPHPMLEPKLPFSGDAHNALQDCLHQIKILFAFMDNLNA